jgi:hypothetical protein
MHGVKCLALEGASVRCAVARLSGLRPGVLRPVGGHDVLSDTPSGG